MSFKLWRLTEVCAAQGSCQTIPAPHGQVIDRCIHFARVGRAGIRLSLRNYIISLTGDTCKMIQDFSTSVQSAQPAHEIFGDYFGTPYICV